MRVPLSADIDRDNAVPASKGASSEWHSIALESKGLAGEGREVPRNVGRRDVGPDRQAAEAAQQEGGQAPPYPSKRSAGVVADPAIWMRIAVDPGVAVR